MTSYHTSVARWMQTLFCGATLAGAMLMPSVGATQSLDVGMPRGSTCPPNYHWEAASGFAQCMADPPPTPPTPPDPPAASYTFIYRVSMTTTRCNGNGCHWDSAVARTTTSTGQWGYVWQGADNTILPWGFDVFPLAASDPPTYSPQDLRQFMGPFIRASCQLASDNAQAKAIIANATGTNLDNPLFKPMAGQTLPNANNGNPEARNYALCQNAIM